MARMCTANTPENEQRLFKALQHMTGALEILDSVRAPGEIGARLDLAVARLRTLLGKDHGIGEEIGALMELQPRRLN